MTSFSCPNCGASLNVPLNQTNIKCSYCGNTIMVPQAARINDFQTGPAISINSTIQSVLDLESNQTEVVSSVFKSTMPWVFGGTIALPLVITAVTFVLMICIFGLVFLSFGSFFTMFR
jgi:DNA-directed RNA polymerase subunit RPC12/RpoP